MSRLSFFFTTLIAAVPAAFLAYLLIAAFLFSADKLSTMLMVVAGLTLLLSVAVVLLPAAVFLTGRGRKAAPAAEPAGAAESGEIVEADDDFGAGGSAAEDEEVFVAEDDDVFVEGDADDFEAGDELDDIDQPKKRKR